MRSKKALQVAGLPDIRWHDLRHTYASLQFEACATPKHLSGQMGHVSVQITMDRYSHLLQDADPGQAARLSDLVFRQDGANGCYRDKHHQIKRRGEEGKTDVRQNGLTTDEERPERTSGEKPEEF